MVVGGVSWLVVLWVLVIWVVALSGVCVAVMVCLEVTNFIDVLDL